MYSDEKLSPLKRFWMLLKPDQNEIRGVYVYAVFIGILNLSLPIGIQAIINLIQGGAVNTSWLVLVALVISAIALSGLMQIAQLKIIENIQQKIFTRAAFEFVYRIPRLRLDKLGSQYAPELMNRFFDVVSVQKGMSKILVDFTSAGIQVLFGILLLSIYHPFFIVFSLLLIALIYVIFRATAKKGLETSLQESKYKYSIAHWLEELARTNETFKLAGKTNLPLENLNGRAEGYIAARESHFKILIKQLSLMVVFKVLVALGLLLLGGLLVIEQQINIGQFVAAELIILLIIGSVEKLILSFETIYDVLTAIEKIGQVTDLEIDETGGLTIAKEQKGVSVELSNVSFSYPDALEPQLVNMSLLIQPGERVHITGESESGKSTILYLIAGLYRPTVGAVCIDNIPYQNFDQEELHSVIGGYLRDERLFEGTLLENITIGRERATFENVQWAIANLGLEALVKHLPYGYDTKILPHGRQFSKSTVAKILIARAIVDKPRLLVLENMFSLLTPEDRKAIQSFLLDKNHPWTVVLSSSESLDIPSLIDQEIIVKAGKIMNA